MDETKPVITFDEAITHAADVFARTETAGGSAADYITALTDLGRAWLTLAELVQKYRP